MKYHRRAFSLIEMAMVLGISGLMLSYVMQASKSAEPTSECRTSTHAQLLTIQAAVEQFAHQNNRLPLPARRDVGVEDPLYGREATATGTTTVVGASTWGALPFEALGLSPNYAADCWGNKFTYVVTTALTTANATGGYPDTSVGGAIALKKDTSVNTINTNTTYAVISHGEDGLGATKADSTHASWCPVPAPMTLPSMNCSAASATVADATFNDGKDAGANYFDDLIITDGRVGAAPSQPGGGFFGWGNNICGSVGDGRDNTSDITPTAGLAGFTFTQVGGGQSACGLTPDGKAYCWGCGDSNASLGIGVPKSFLPSLTTPGLVSGGHIFTQLAAGNDHSCGLTATGQAWCWGDNTYGEIGDGTNNNAYGPVAVPGFTFTHIYADNSVTCGIIASGASYCWGWNQFGQLGDGTTISRSSPTLVLGNHLFKQFALSGQDTCALTTSGADFCWGRNLSGQSGISPNWPDCCSPHSTPMPVAGGHIFAQITNNCALTATGQAWCWGENEYGSIGNGTINQEFDTPTLVSSGGLAFVQITSDNLTTCALTADGTAYCWGENGDGINPNQSGGWDGGRVGDGTTTDRYIPTPVIGGHKFSQIHTEATTMGVIGVPPGL